MTSARFRSEFTAPLTQQLCFPFCSCGATVLTIEKTATCAKCGDTLVREGMHIKVGPTSPNGKPHPHAGKTGRITKCINIYSDPRWLGPPSAMIELDSGLKPRGFIWVSHASSGVLSGNASVRVETQRVPISVPRNGEVSRDEARQKKFGLTPRELEILSALEAHHSSKELAEHFRISEDTVKHYLSNIYQELDVGGSVWHRMIRFRVSLVWFVIGVMLLAIYRWLS